MWGDKTSQLTKYYKHRLIRETKLYKIPIGVNEISLQC